MLSELDQIEFNIPIYITEDDRLIKRFIWEQGAHMLDKYQVYHMESILSVKYHGFVIFSHYDIESQTYVINSFGLFTYDTNNIHAHIEILAGIKKQIILNSIIEELSLYRQISRIYVFVYDVDLYVFYVENEFVELDSFYKFMTPYKENLFVQLLKYDINIVRRTYSHESDGF